MADRAAEKAAPAPAVVEVETVDTTCSNCGTTDSGFAFDSQEGWLCGECLIASEESRLARVAKDRSDLFD